MVSKDDVRWKTGEIKGKNFGRTWKHKKKRDTSNCPHCNKIGDIALLKRWHFDNCKELT